MNLLITGISGFLGSHAANILQDQYNIIGTSSTSSAVEGFKIYDAKNLHKIIEEPAVVLMCHAAISTANIKTTNSQLYAANVEFTGQVVNTFPNAYHLYTSTISLYSNSLNVINEGSPVNPLNAYAISKLWGEKIVTSSPYNGVIRLSSLYGTRMKENTIIPVYVDQALKNRTIEVWGNGERLQNYLHVNDAVEYIKKIMQAKSEGIYLGISTRQTSNIELARLIASYTGSEVILKGEDNAFSMRFENLKTKSQLGFGPVTNLADGIKEYIDWKQKLS